MTELRVLAVSGHSRFQPCDKGMNVNTFPPLSAIQGDVVFQYFVPRADTPKVKPTRGDRRAHGAQRTRRSRSHRRGDDSGSTLVEAAFVMPIFVLLIFGIFEFSGMIMAKTGVDAAVKGGTRMAVVAGADPTADMEILLHMEKEGAGISQDHIDEIIIWRASKTGEKPPAGCLAGISNTVPGDPVTGGPAPGSCNVYVNPQGPQGAFARANLPKRLPARPDECTGSQGSCAEDWFGCPASKPIGWSNKLDCGWSAWGSTAHATWGRRILEKSPEYTCSGSDDPKCQGTDLIGIYMKTTHKNYTGFFGATTTTTSTSIGAIEPQGYDK